MITFKYFRRKLIAAVTFIAVFGFSTLTVLAASHTSSPGAPIPTTGTGPGQMTDTLTVTGEGSIITDVTLSLQINHTWLSDLDIQLRSPSGTTIDIIFDDCISDDNLVATFSDSASGRLGVDCANRLAGNTYLPDQPLGLFDGQNPNGTWTLVITDDASADSGTLISWTLNLSTAFVTEAEYVLPSFTDGRINRYDGAAPIAVYPYTEDGIDIYSDDGVLLLRVSESSMSLAECDGSQIAGASQVAVYRTGDCVYQINTPQYNGKTYVLRFSEIFTGAVYESFEY